MTTGSGAPRGRAADLLEEELVQREEKAQAEVTERLAGSVTESVQAAREGWGMRWEGGD